MIIEYIRYVVPEDRAQALIDAYRAAGNCLATSPHSLGYDIAQCVDEPGNVTVRMHWDSADGHRSGFRNSAAFREFLPLVRPFIADIAEMRHYTHVGGPGISTPAG